VQIKKLKKLRDSLANLRLPCFLNSIDSIRQLILWLVVYFCIAFIAANLINWFRGSFPSYTWEAFKNTLLFTVIMGVVEEGVFRGFTKWVLGNAGLVIGTLVWVGLHQFDANPPPLFRIPIDLLFGIFYVKLWRGKFWWLSLFIQPLWNIGILYWWESVFPLLNCPHSPLQIRQYRGYSRVSTLTVVLGVN
jgi:hypothetical protein